jgi:hypothetical protein
MRTTFLRVVVSTCAFFPACADQVPASPPAISTETGTTEPSSGDEDPAPWAAVGGQPCLVDADCTAGAYCELRECTPGCSDDAGCELGTSCDAHGRCVTVDEPAPPALGSPYLTQRRTTLAWGETEARTTLQNTGDRPMRFRLAAYSSAIGLDPTLAEIGPGESIDLVVALDLDQLTAEDRVLPVRIITSGGTIPWILELPQGPGDGLFRGGITFGADGVGAGSTLVLALVFHEDGSVSGQVEPSASLLWREAAAVGGNWTPAGALTLSIADILAPAAWQDSFVAREVGRVVTLTGTVSSDGQHAQGVADATLAGLREDLVALTGAFTLHRAGALPGDLPVPVAPMVEPLRVEAPGWHAPPDFDMGACEGLGMAYGTPQTLPDLSHQCDACADGACSASEKAQCADVLWTAAYQLPAVLSALQGQGVVQPPAGKWTWDDCTAATPVYFAGTACLDAAALRCGTALIRESLSSLPDWSPAIAAGFAVYEGDAAALLATEARLDAAFTYHDTIGQPPATTIARELDLLAAARERLAAALVPLAAPVHTHGLDLLGTLPDDVDLVAARRQPLRLAALYAEAVVSHARLAYQAGANADELRAGVREAALAIHALVAQTGADLAQHEVPADREVARIGPALRQLEALFTELSGRGSPFGYRAAYVPMALTGEDIEHGRTNFDAVYALAVDDVSRFGELAEAAFQAARDYEQKAHSTQAAALQVDAEYDRALRELCGSRPGDTAPALDACGEQGGKLAELTAGIAAADLRIKHAAQALDNSLYAIDVEEERFARVLEAQAFLKEKLDEAHGRIFTIQDSHGQERSVLVQAEAAAECARIRDNLGEDLATLKAECNSRLQEKMLSGPAIFGFSTPDLPGMVIVSKECDARQSQIEVAADNQCKSVQGSAGLDNALDALQREEDREIMTVNWEIDQLVRDSEIEAERAGSVALVKNLRAEGLLLQIEIEEAQLARRTAITSAWSAFHEAAALAQAKSEALALLVEDSPDNALTRPHFLQMRLEAAGRVLRAREVTSRRVYLALRALEYELGQEFLDLRETLLAARSPEDFEGLLACLDSIREDSLLHDGAGQAYVTEVSLRADVFGITGPIPDIDGSDASPAEQFVALLQDPAHRQPDGTIALPFMLSGTEDSLFSALLCDDRIERIETKLVGDYLGDREAEIMITREGLTGVRRCDAADLPLWAGYVPYSFERDQVVIQAGVGDWGTAGPNAGFAGWPVHGEQWTLTIPAPELSPANADIDPARIADVVLRLHHRARTLGPAGQGVFSPSCG